MEERTKLEAALDELIEGKSPEEIAGPGGLLKQLTKALLERAMNLAHLKFGKATEQLLSIGEKRIQLLEQELKAPGRELAYLASMRQRFGKTP